MISTSIRRRASAAETWVLSRGAALVSLATRRASAFWSAVGYEESAAYLRKLLR